VKVYSNRLFTAVAVTAFVIGFGYAPSASADNIAIQNNTGCAAGISGICPGGGPTAFSVTDLNNGTETLVEPGLTPAATVGNSTVPTYILTNDTGSTTFTLNFSGTLANNAFLDCQENGAFAGQSCSITGSLGTVGTGVSYGPPSGQTTPWNPDVTITFNGVPLGATFDLTFSSFAHAGTDTGSIVPTPEPSTTLLLSFGLLAGLGLSCFRRTRLA
jgi:hypothetical protein